MENETTTLRKELLHRLKEAQCQATRIRRALKRTPEELLDLEVQGGSVYFWKYEKKVHMTYRANLGEEKGTRFRDVSARLLKLSGLDQVKTRINKFYKGMREQDFAFPNGRTIVELFWTDKDLKEIPCHKVTVVRNVDIEWCGEGDPPLQKGDVILKEIR